MSIREYPASYETAPEERLPIPQAIIDLRLQYGYDTTYDHFLYDAVGQVVSPGDERTEPAPLIEEYYGWDEQEYGPFSEVVYSGYSQEGGLFHIRKRGDYYLMVYADIFNGSQKLLDDIGMERIEIEGNSVMRFTYGPDDPVVIVEFEGEALGRAHIAPTQDSTLFTEARPLYELQEKITELEQLNEALLAQVSGILAVGKTTEV